MATNLRLGAEAQDALRAEAKRSGRSQQELLREAVDRYLGLGQPLRPATEADALIASGLVHPARNDYRKTNPRRRLPSGVSSLDLLDRDDRI